MKKGFTLIELISVIVLLAAILLVIVPVVTKQVKEGKDKQYENQIVFIKQAMQIWASENYVPKDGEIITITVSQLKADGYVKHDLKNPTNDEYFANDTILQIKNTDGIITYEVNEEGNFKSDYLEIPKIVLNGDPVVKAELGNAYSDLGAKAYTASGEELNNLVTNNNVNTNVIGSYTVDYIISYNGKDNIVKRNVIVADTLAPVISFNGDLTIPLTSVLTYNFKSDVSVTDSSSYTLDVDTNFTNIKGVYSIRYIATDIYGNTSTKVRKVIVN